MVTNLTKSLLDTISIIANKSIEEVSSDKTIKAVVKKIINTSEHKYLVTYNSGDFYAYVQSGSTEIYQPDEQVYILIPKGDMSQKKFIIGKVESNEEPKASKTITNSLLNDYIMIGDNAVIENKYRLEDNVFVKRMQPLELDPYKISDFYYCYLHDPDAIEDLPQEYYNTFEYPSVDIDEEVFNNSAKQAEALLIRANFKTSIDTESVGNYGIIVNVAFADRTNPQVNDDGSVTYPPKLIAYVLDTSKMTGNPMKFYDYTSQYMIADFDGENYLYIDSIVAFSEGFTSQVISSYENNTNIYMDNLEIVALYENSATNGDYKLKLTTPWGNTIKINQRDDLKIIATMSYLNQNITENTTFYWGVKDPSVTSMSDGYSAKLGSGYRYIDIENTNELILAPSDLNAAENIYICVASYESEIILKINVSIFNNNNKLNITIDSDQGDTFQFSEGNPILTCLINGKTSNYQENYPDDAFSFVWSKEDAEFGSILLDITEAQLETDKQRELTECTNNNNNMSNAGRTVTQILSYYSTRIAQVKNIAYLDGVHGPRIRCGLKNTNVYATYSCSVYRAGVYVGYGSITLQNAKNIINNNYYVTITNGTQVFQYDEIGIAPNSPKKENPIEVLDLIAVFHSPQGVEVTPRKVRWIMPEGKTLINIPSVGLETDFETGEKYFSGNIFPLTIKEIYDNTYDDNQLTVIVTHIDGTEYRQSTNLLFTKVGEIGTNGTDTVVKINELIDTPKDECLTIIKLADGEAFYNNGYSVNNTVLETNLYTNNTQVLGHTTNWTIAGSSNKRSYSYKVEEDNDNSCFIEYDGDNTAIDTRIIEAETSLNGKYFHSFYGMPAIEYAAGYSYDDYPIKVMKDGTLKTVLYSSGGTNPVYNENQGAHIELPDWDETGYINWRVESGPKRDNRYVSPNLLLSGSPKSRTGSEELKITNKIDSIQSNVLQIRDTSQFCKDAAVSTVKTYIQDFLTDIEKIGVDTLLSTPNKITRLQNRIAAFGDEKNIPDKENIYIKTLYEKYSTLFEQMENEYNLCKDINKESTKIYDNIHMIWASEWPEVITQERLSTRLSSGITSIQQLVNRYQQAYDDRSNESVSYELNRFDIKDDNDNVITASIFKDNSRFLTLLGDSEDYDSGLDEYYNDYVTSLGVEAVRQNAILVEYDKILMAYLNLIIEEAQDCFDGEYSYRDDTNNLINLYTKIKEIYDFAYSDWDTSVAASQQIIGKNIYDSIVAANGEIANIYDNIRGLYKYYQALYLGVKKYQIAEESKTLNIWVAILNGQRPNLFNQVYAVPNDTFNGLYMNNNIVGEVSIKVNNTYTTVATVYVPIIMTLNTYELSSLNGWDGTNVDVGDGHILTPQIGAGIKDSTTNTFTGMVMGVVGNTAVNNNDLLKTKKIDKVGLAGYSNGKQSMFIDAETGKAYFGLPENDTNTEEGINEGRIELIPGGVSKIGNWKIGNRFLYNIVDGSYERRADRDARDQSLKNKMMVPHDKHGIILSSDQPYIHVKGEVYEDDNIKGINYEDEYNNINPGDSLELRMDPSDKSLFSIVQHTAGFGDEDVGDLFFGYKTANSDSSVIIVKNYIANQNTQEDEDGTDYYVYRLDTDLNGDYKPYYRQENNSDFYKVNANSWLRTINVYNNNLLLSDVLTEEYFKKNIATNESDPVFSINSDTGIITYNPNNLIWNNQVVGFTNGEGWQSVTEETSATNFPVILRYTKNIEDSPIETDYNIGQIYNNTFYKIHRMKIINCTLHRELTGISLNSPSDGYIQFYIVSNPNQTIEDALLISDIINIWNNQDNIDIELSSYNNRYLSSNTYYLKINININTYTINTDCSCNVSNRIVKSYIAPPMSSYGTVEITEITDGEPSDFITSGGSISRLTGQYIITRTINNKWDIQFKIIGSQIENETSATIPNTNSLTYDFVLWRKGSDTATGGGQTAINNWAKFFTTTDKTWNSLNDYIELDYAPSVNNPWCISFYPKEYCTTESVNYITTTTPSSNNQNTTGTIESQVTITIGSNGNFIETVNNVVGGYSDSVENTTNESIQMVNMYRLNSDSIIPIENRNVYDIDWGIWNTTYYYNTIELISNLKLINFEFGDILAFIPEDTNKLCIEENTNIFSLQGIPYVQTYWDQNNNQKIKIFKEYYDWVNTINNNQNQYSYIDIVVNNNIYYKYIKTLIKKKINNWFISDSLPDNFESGDKINGVYSWIIIPTSLSIFKDSLYWKDFLRIGIDENGRFFSAGRQDKKTYSRTGKIYSFGKVIDLYGQEIKTQLYSDRYIPVIKIFTQMTDSSTWNTTYITQGQDDNGNISIRTADNNHFVELAASQFSNNEENTVPDKINYVKVGYNTGIEIQTNKGENKINLTNNNKLLIETGIISIFSKDINNNIKTSYNMTDDGYIWTTSPFYIVSSILAPSARSASSMSLADSDNINGGHYRINASNNNNNPIIQLQVGKNKVGLDIDSTKVILKSDASHFIEINAGINTTSFFKANNMKLEFNNNSETTILQNGLSYIKLIPDNDDSLFRSILLYHNSSSQINIGNSIEIKGNGGTFIDSTSTFKKNIYIKSNLYSNKDFYIGYSADSDQSNQSAIYLYNDDQKNYVKISASDLKQLFDWYNNNRWLIGCYGNTVIMRNVSYNNNPEGSPGNNKYVWSWKTFNGYTNRGWE